MHLHIIKQRYEHLFDGSFTKSDKVGLESESAKRDKLRIIKSEDNDTINIRNINHPYY